MHKNEKKSGNIIYHRRFVIDRPNYEPNYDHANEQQQAEGEEVSSEVRRSGRISHHVNRYSAEEFVIRCPVCKKNISLKIWIKRFLMGFSLARSNVLNILNNSNVFSFHLLPRSNKCLLQSKLQIKI